MTGSELKTLIQRYTRTTSVTYTDALLLADVNNVKNEFANQIVQRNEQMFVIPTKFDLVASDVDAREYSFPTDVLNHIVTVEGAFDTTKSTVFVPILPYIGGLQRLLRQTNGITESKITSIFTNEKPRYYLTRRGFYILSGTISVLSDGGILRYRLWPEDLPNLTGSTDLSLDPSTTTFGIPRNFHELWARRVSIKWKSLKPKPIPLSVEELNYPNDLKEALNGISDDDYGKQEFATLPAGDSASRLGADV